MRIELQKLKTFLRDWNGKKSKKGDMLNLGIESMNSKMRGKKRAILV